MNKVRTYSIVGLIVGISLLGGQYLVHAADQGARGGSFVVTSSTANSNVTDLWVVDQSSRTVFLCRASGSGVSAPTCTKGTHLP
jgi:hypothetical protein